MRIGLTRSRRAHSAQLGCWQFAINARQRLLNGSGDARTRQRNAEIDGKQLRKFDSTIEIIIVFMAARRARPAINIDAINEREKDSAICSPAEWRLSFTSERAAREKGTH